MAFNIKNDEVERLVRRISAETGEWTTETIRTALERRGESMGRGAIPRCCLKVVILRKQILFPLYKTKAGYFFSTDALRNSYTVCIFLTQI